MHPNRLISIFFIVAIAASLLPAASAAICGNNVIEIGENSCTCPQDAGICGPAPGEICAQYECDLQNICQKTNVSGCCGNNTCEDIENFANCSEDCKPQTLDFEIILPQTGESFARGQTGTIVVGITALGIDITSAEVTTDGYFGNLEFFNDGKHGDGKVGDKIYGAFFKVPKNAIEGTQIITVTADYRNVIKQIKIPIQIKPQITTQLLAPKNVLLGNTIFVNGQLSVGTYPVATTLDLNLTDTTGRPIDQKTVITDSNGKFSYSFRTSQTDAPGIWHLNGFGTDQNQNTASFAIPINVVDPTAERNLQVETIIETTQIKRGEEFAIIARISDLNELVIDATVELADPQNRRFPFVLQENGDYFLNYQAPFDLPLGEQAFEIIAQKTAGITLQGNSTLIVTISQKPFTIEIVEPTQKTFTVGDSIPFKFLAKYSANQPVLDATAELIVGNNKLALQSQGGGFYFAIYQPNENDIGTLAFEAFIKDPYNNQTLSNGNIEVFGFGTGYYLSKYGLLFFIIAILCSAALFAVRIGFLKKNENKSLQNRKSQLIELEKDIQTKYFNDASIEKKEFDQSMEKYENELKQIEKKLGGNKK